MDVIETVQRDALDTMNVFFDVEDGGNESAG
jgi:hypothetical protein